MTHMKFFQAMFAALIVITPAFSSEFALDKVVVTATKTEKKIKDVPVRTEVVTSEMLEKEHARNAVDALRYIPGLQIQDVHGKNGKEVWIQGIDSDRVLVLVNGERVSPSTGSSIDLTQLSVANIKQIEIVKGAASALYGSSAMGGVINIITKEADEGFHGKLQGSVGTYGDKNRTDSELAAHHTRAELSYRTKAWSLDTNIDRRDSEGYLVEKDSATLRGEDGYKENAAINLELTPNQHQSYQLSYGTYDEDYIIHDAIIIPGQTPLDRSEKVESNHTSFAVDWVVSDNHDINARIYQDDFHDASETQVSRVADITINGIELQHNWIRNNYILTSGLVSNNDILEQLRGGVTELNGDEIERNSKEIYTQLDYFINDNWEVLPGFRYEDDNIFGGHFSPKISAMYSHQTNNGADGRFRVSYGNGYRVPNLKERYYIFDHSHVGYQVLGNVDLQPETSHSLQVGYEFQTNNGLRLEANFFHNRINDLIETSLHETQNTDSGPVAIYRYDNIEKAQTQGIELSSNYLLLPNLQVSAAYTYLDADNLTTGKKLVKRPDSQIKLGADWRLRQDKANLAIRATYESSSYIDEDNFYQSPSWTQWDIKYTDNITEGIQFYAGVDNVFDTHRDPTLREKDLRPLPGRYIYLGTMVSF